ncbi:Hypothetical_protein [Hexamita inflata]|uniref:Hypothetical_protein n=1 Tax=Hexamita inflata TaxID=28002 RepID=A0AA86UVY2_9EUKA|nr:Hypothetical protein HINF_LOCUS54481 [Hexamita inflata]
MSPLIIVCLLLVCIYYFLFSLPIQRIIYIIVQKKYYRSRLAKATQRKQEIKIKQHQISDLMFPFKPFPSIDMYISVAYGQIVLMNSSLMSMNAQSLKYYFQPGQTEQFCYYVIFKKCKRFVQETSLTLQPGWTQNTCTYNNQQYVVIFDFIFILSNLDLQLVAKIPDYGLFNYNYQSNLNLSAQMFTLNGKLYVHNNSSKLFKINEKNKLKCVNKKLENYFYAQFCDKVYAISFNKIQKLNQDFKLELIEEIQSSRLIFCSNAVLILLNKDWQIERKCNLMYIVNMLDGRVIPWLDVDHQFINMDISNQIVSEPQINQDALELDQTGFKIKDKLIDQILGIEFRKRVSDYRSTYECKQKTFVNANKMYEFVFKAELELILEPQFKRTISAFRVLSETIQNKLQETNTTVSRLVEIQNQMVQTYNFMYEEIELNNQ